MTPMTHFSASSFSAGHNQGHTREATTRTKVAVAHGDGIGPQIMDAVLFLLDQAGAAIEPLPIEIGEQVYQQGVTSGIAPDAWDKIEQTKVVLKAPITTPRGKGYKSLNVTLRKALGLYANVRPCQTFAPHIPTAHPGMDVIIVRENEEDTYGGIEHRQTAEVTQCLKLITQPGCEKIVRYAFELAKRSGRKKVTCMVKDNIMKMTDGLFRQTFEEIAAEYPDIDSESMIIDIASARLAKNPEQFDVVVLPNLYGDIVSDIAAEISGSVGLCGSANIGQEYAMFEAVHGSAPDIAGQGIANPSGLLHAAIQMLAHIGQPEVATRLHNAWLCTIEDGVLTVDVAPKNCSKKVVGTDAFAHAVANRLGQKPKHLPEARYEGDGEIEVTLTAKAAKPSKQLVGVDVFLDWDEQGRDPKALGAILEALSTGMLDLKMITNRGTSVYPHGHAATFCTDHWRCRFTNPQGEAVSHQDVLRLLAEVDAHGLDFIKTELLYTFDGQAGYSLGQGE